MSELHNYIKARNGRSSSKLVQSFRNFLKKKGLDPDIQHNWDLYYESWINTVTQLYQPLTSSDTNFDITKLYKTIQNMEATIKEKDLRIKQLESELAACMKNLRFKSPPANVLRAMADFGD